MRSMRSEIEPVRPMSQSVYARGHSKQTPQHDIGALNFREFRIRCLSVPIIFIALLRQSGLPFAVYPNRRDPDGWCFKFQRRFVLELDSAGRANWASMEPGLRHRLQSALDQALNLHTVRQRGRPRRRLRSS